MLRLLSIGVLVWFGSSQRERGHAGLTFDLRQTQNLTPTVGDELRFKLSKAVKDNEVAAGEIWTMLEKEGGQWSEYSAWVASTLGDK